MTLLQQELPPAQPLLRWAGGKSWLVERLVPEIVAAAPARYVEPFVGAGAIALAVPPSIPKVLADASKPLMNLWEMVQRQPAALHAALLRVHRDYGNDRERYYQARERFNASQHYGVNDAALMLYLNSVSFNGLHRENSKGQYNVPFGDVKRPRMVSLEDLLAVQQSIRSAQLCCCDFREVVAIVGAGDATFVDPPYWGGFDDYVAGGFSEADQRELAQQLEAAAQRGAAIWATNSDTPLIREAYAWAKIEPIVEERSIAADGARRGGAGCVLIRAL